MVRSCTTAVEFYKNVAERGRWTEKMMQAYAAYKDKRYGRDVMQAYATYTDGRYVRRL